MSIKAADVIREYMERNKITYREVARRSGRSGQNIWNILNGNAGNKPTGAKGGRDPNYKTILDVCDALGLKVTITKTEERESPDEIVRAAELLHALFSTVQRILQAAGFLLQIETPEEKATEK